MKNDPAALAVACVTSVYESRSSGASMIEQAVGLRDVVDGLTVEELQRVVATMTAWLVSELPDDPESARTFLQSIGLSLSTDRRG